MYIYGTEYTPVSSSYFTGTLACTFSLPDLYFTYIIGIQNLLKIIQEVCRTIWEELQLSFMSVPSQEDWLQISPKFEQCANFPNCIGRYRCPTLRIVKPVVSRSVIHINVFFSHLLYWLCVMPTTISHTLIL